MNYSESIAIVAVVPVVAVNVQPAAVKAPIGVKVSNELCSQLIKSKSPSLQYS